MIDSATSSFLFSTVVTLFLSVAIYYYFSLKVKNIEKALIQQNQVLADFIVQVKTNLNTSESPNPTALHAAQITVDSQNPHNSTIIPVSDDENDSGEDSDNELDDDSTDLESEEEDNNQSSELNQEIKTILANHSSNAGNSLIQIDKNLNTDLDILNAVSGMVIISNDNLDVNTNILDISEQNNLDVLNLEDITQKSSYDILNSLTKDQTSDDNEEEDEEEDDEEEELENVEDTQLTDKDNFVLKNNLTNFHSLKVSKLRELALDKGLNIAGKKKNEIIALLSTE
ncbi:polycomb protein [bacterium]|nr:polycomb protein [bacterium]